MKRDATLTITSVLSIVLTAVHFADDIVRGIEPGGLSTLVGVLILVVWLYGALELADRRAGYIIMLVAALGGAAIPVIHMMGRGLVGGRIANSPGVFLWVWTLIALGVTASFSAILSARELWRRYAVTTRR